MIREDLFMAIGDADDTCLARCDKSSITSPIPYWEESDTEFEEKIRRGRIRNALLIAAIIALTLFLMGCAIAALVRMRVDDVKLFAQNNEHLNAEENSTFIGFREEETIYDHKVFDGEIVNFDKVQDVFIELGRYYPQVIPEGYTITFVSNDAPLQNQIIRYENAAGNLIEYNIYAADPASSIEIYEIETKTDVQIHDQPGILYEQKGGRRTLVWINSSKGYGFSLQTNDPAVDLLAMAASTAEGEPLTPTHSEKTQMALDELGDFSPEYLPEGFEELNVDGWPLADGGGWYSYVRKWYVNKAENTIIYFTYETYAIVTEVGYTDDARTACSFFIPGYQILEGKTVGEEITINGMFGIASTHDIAWADPETHRVFHLHSKDISPEELLKVAQSITQSQ